MKTCKEEGCGNPVWSKGLCRNHVSKKRIRASRKNDVASRMDDIKEMQKFFLGIWSKRGHYSEISGEKLFSPPSTLYFHHILLKSVHPQAKFDEANIILLLPEEHQNVHLNLQRYEEINRRREELLKKYNLK